MASLNPPHSTLQPPHSTLQPPHSAFSSPPNTNTNSPYISPPGHQQQPPHYTSPPPSIHNNYPQPPTTNTNPNNINNNQPFDNYIDDNDDEEDNSVAQGGPLVTSGNVNITYLPTDFDQIPSLFIGPKWATASNFLFGRKPGAPSVGHIAFFYGVGCAMLILVALMSFVVYQPGSFAERHMVQGGRWYSGFDWNIAANNNGASSNDGINVNKGMELNQFGYMSFAESKSYNDWLTAYTVGHLTMNNLPPLKNDHYSPQDKIFASKNQLDFYFNHDKENDSNMKTTQPVKGLDVHRQITPLDTTSPFHFQFAMSPTDLFTQRYRDTQMEFRIKEMVGNDEWQKVLNNNTNQNGPTQDTPLIDPSLPQFKYYHDRTFYALRPPGLIPQLTLANALSVEALLVDNYFNFLSYFIDNIFTFWDEWSIIPLPSFIRSPFRPSIHYYQDGPFMSSLDWQQQENLSSQGNNIDEFVPNSLSTTSITKSSLDNNSNNSKENFIGNSDNQFHPQSQYISNLHAKPDQVDTKYIGQTLITRLSTSAFNYLLSFILIVVIWGGTYLHMFHECYIHSLTHFITARSLIFTSIHCAFIVMYRYYVYSSTLMTLFTFMGPYVIHIFYQLEFILFGSFAEPFTLLKIPLQIVPLFFYFVYIGFGWLLVGDAIRGDVITIFVMYILPFIIIFYYTKGALELYTIIDKQQANHINVLVQQHEESIETIPRNTDTLTTTSNSTRNNAISNHHSTNNKNYHYSPKPTDIFPIPPLSMAHNRIFYLTIIYALGYIIGMMTKPLGIVNVYINITLAWIVPLLFINTVWTHPIAVKRTKLPPWLSGDDAARMFGQDPEQYLDVTEQKRKQQAKNAAAKKAKNASYNQANSNVNTTTASGQNVQVSYGNNGVPDVVVNGKKIDLEDYIPKYKNTQHGLYTSIVPSSPLNPDSDLSDLEGGDFGYIGNNDQSPYPPPPRLPKAYSNMASSSEDDLDEEELYDKEKFDSRIDPKSYKKGNTYETDSDTSDTDYDDDGSDNEGEIVDRDTSDRKFMNFLRLNIPNLNLAPYTMATIALLLITIAIVVTSGQVGLFQQQYDVHKPNVYSIPTTTSTFEIQQDQEKSQLSTQQVNLGTNYENLIPKPVNPELEQTIENIYANPNLNSGWANLATGCYGHSSLTGSKDFSAQAKPNDQNSTTNKKIIPRNFQLEEWETSITPSKLHQNIELNMLKQLFFNQYIGLREYVDKNQVALDNINQQIDTQYPKISVSDIVTAIQIDLKAEDDNSNKFVVMDNLEFSPLQASKKVDLIAEQPNMTILYTTSPTIPSKVPLTREEVKLRERRNLKRHKDENSTDNTNQQNIGPNLDNHISLALPYHLLYSLYTHHYSTFAQDARKDHSSTKQEKLKYSLDSVSLPIRARWHAYSSIATIDELFIKCRSVKHQEELDTDEYEAYLSYEDIVQKKNTDQQSAETLKKYHNFINNDENFDHFDIKMQLLSYLSCDQRVAQTIIIDEDISRLQKCLKPNINNNPVMDSPGDNTEQDKFNVNSDGPSQVNPQFRHQEQKQNINNVIINDNIYFNDHDVNLTMKFLLSHFDSIVAQHDKSRQHAENNMSSSSSQFTSMSVAQPTTQPPTSAFANAQTIAMPLSPYLIEQIDFANHYFAVTFITTWILLVLGLGLFILSATVFFPRIRYVD